MRLLPLVPMGTAHWRAEVSPAGCLLLFDEAKGCLIGMEMSQQHPTSSFLFLEARMEGEWGFELCRDLRCFSLNTNIQPPLPVLCLFTFSLVFICFPCFSYHDNGGKR